MGHYLKSGARCLGCLRTAMTSSAMAKARAAEAMPERFIMCSSVGLAELRLYNAREVVDTRGSAVQQEQPRSLSVQ